MNYEHLAKDIILWMKQDHQEDSWFTTMIDYFRLPTDFPGRGTSSPTLTSRQRVNQLEQALIDDITGRLGDLTVSSRLIPYIQLHEFEALLFSDPNAFLQAFPEDQEAVNKLTAIRSQFSCPEDIDKGPTTAPSKRILNILPDYQKTVAGILIAQRIGLATIRSACPHFDEWLTRLIRLGHAKTP